jgi:hypothetical protein
MERPHGKSYHSIHTEFLRNRSFCSKVTNKHMDSAALLSFLLYHVNSHDSSVGIALGYGLDDRGSRVRFPAGAENFSLHYHVQNGSGAHPTSYAMSTMDSFPGGKVTGA